MKEDEIVAFGLTMKDIREIADALNNQLDGYDEYSEFVSASEILTPMSQREYESFLASMSKKGYINDAVEGKDR